MTKLKPASSAKPSRNTWIALCSAIAIASMTGCATSSTPPSVVVRPAQPPADLAQPCPELPLLSDGTAKTLALWIVDASAMYRDCAARHAGLVRAWPGQKSFSDAVK